jgi:hypothetical protein
VGDESHPKYHARTFKIGQRKYKVSLGLCVRGVDAVAILKAYSEDMVVDRRVDRIPLRRSFSEEQIYEIFEAGSWRSDPEPGFANSEYVVGLVLSEGFLHLQFVSVDNDGVVLWAEEVGTT